MYGPYNRCPDGVYNLNRVGAKLKLELGKGFGTDSDADPGTDIRVIPPISESVKNSISEDLDAPANVMTLLQNEVERVNGGDATIMNTEGQPSDKHLRMAVDLARQIMFHSGLEAAIIERSTKTGNESFIVFSQEDC